MRHINPISLSFISSMRGKPLSHPSKIPYTYGRLSTNRRYIQVINFVKNHPNCKRIDIIKGIWGYGNSSSNRGYMSTLFSNLLYRDFIDYDKKFCYHVTEKGLALLQKAHEFDTYK